MFKAGWVTFPMTLLLGWPALLAAQTTGTIAGTVLGTLNADPVANAIVVVESPTVKRETATDAAGKYRIADLPPAAYHLVVRKNEFLPYRADITVKAGEQMADVSLDPELHFSEVTSVSPEGRSQFESFQATNVLGGQELTKELRGTLAATIENEPGVAQRSFGPGPWASRHPRSRW